MEDHRLPSTYTYNTHSHGLETHYTGPTLPSISTSHDALPRSSNSYGHVHVSRAQLPLDQQYHPSMRGDNVNLYNQKYVNSPTYYPRPSTHPQVSAARPLYPQSTPPSYNTTTNHTHPAQYVPQLYATGTEEIQYPASPPRPYGCDMCALSFNRQHDLKRHRETHSGDKPFPCEGCGKSFTRKDALKRHQTVKKCGMTD